MKKEYSYTESFNLVDIRLFICTTACLFSLFAVAYDYLHPFPESKYVLATCSIRYPFAIVYIQSRQYKIPMDLRVKV